MSEHEACAAMPPWKRRVIRIGIWVAIVTPLVLWPQIAGTVIAIVALLALVLWYGIKWKIKQLLHSLEVAQHSLLETPETISPRPAPGIKWRDIRAVTRNRRALASLGFTAFGTYSIDELDGARVEGMTGPDPRVFALVHDNAHGCYVEFLARWEDGGHIAFSNGGSVHTVDLFSRRALRQFPDLSAETLFERFTRYAPQLARLPLDPESFGQDYARLYLEKRARYTLDDAHEGDEVSIRKSFLEQCDWSAAQWEARRDRLFFVHDRMDPEEVAARYLDLREPSEEENDEAVARVVARIGEKPPREAFTELLADVADAIEPVMAIGGNLPADAYLSRRLKTSD